MNFLNLPAALQVALDNIDDILFSSGEVIISSAVHRLVHVSLNLGGDLIFLQKLWERGGYVMPRPDEWFNIDLN